MDCTGAENRRRICEEYAIQAIGCIALYGGRQVISDAGGKVITDKYYKFLCTHNMDGHQEFIQCGYPTARHICQLSGIDIPKAFNPFLDNAGGGGGGGEVGGRTPNRGRRQLDTVINLFITSKDAVLQPGSAIYNIKDRVESDMYNEVEWRDVKAVNTILGQFHTSAPGIVEELARYGTVRHFDFNLLIRMVNDHGINPNNYI